MSEPTLDEVREAKEAVIRQLKGHRDFAGVGIGRGRDGKLVVQVNWRAAPAGFTPPAQIGKCQSERICSSSFSAFIAS